MAKKNKNYTTYEVFDFLMDPEFKNWIRQNDAASDLYWQSVMQRYPEKKDAIEKAIELAKNTAPSKPNAPNERQRALWQNIEQEINKAPSAKATKTKRLKHNLLLTSKYAAVLLLVIGIGLLIRAYESDRTIMLSTGNGENKKFTLPDGSFVQLAPNSSIRFYKKLQQKVRREVWTTGDVYFKVTHLNKSPAEVKVGERFVVHMDHEIDVEVLGTVFNVSNRRGSTQVHLESGSVKVIKSSQSLLLKPGQSVLASKANGLHLAGKAATKVSTDWDSNLLLLHKTSIAAIIELLADNYGIVLQVDDKQMLLREIDGAIPLDDEDKALKILSSITGSNLERHNGQLTLTTKK
ncbi:FecR family protein [Pedobacter sp. MC2016-24]|uniref:FecR family protein n=1 Tax=Pedobacter sp. MC2016-24 TaxID=2780090 RepID=UPI00187E2296|nr:FecR domain-containing protein [Pedobacter sp. MC2016-24]MBE9601691.1 FecR domain-containing protein [Pedobacter sp. MC2016-24]